MLEPSDLGIYEVLLSLYFPRTSAEEETACWQLPADIGGMDGEPQFPDRQIRIIDNPQHTLHANDGNFNNYTYCDVKFSLDLVAFILFCFPSEKSTENYEI